MKHDKNDKIWLEVISEDGTQELHEILISRSLLVQEEALGGEEISCPACKKPAKIQSPEALLRECYVPAMKPRRVGTRIKISCDHCNTRFTGDHIYQTKENT